VIATASRYLDFYRATSALGFKSFIHYRGAFFLGMIGFLGEPVVYLVVWSQVAEAQGGSVGGLTIDQVVTYYIVWTLVRNLTSFRSPLSWQNRIAEGSLSDQLLRPIHPLHDDYAGDLGTKFVIVPLWVPIGVALGLVFRPSLDLSVPAVTGFAVAVVLAWILRGMMFSLVGLAAFRTTRVSGLMQVFLAIELLLSGRLVPLSFYPDALATAAEWLPWYRSFGFAIEVASLPMTGREILVGLGASVGWVVALIALYAVLWRRAVRHYSAVSG